MTPDPSTNPPAVQTQPSEVRVAMARLEQHSGPLPSPETLRAYAELIPEGGDRLMKMVESEAIHRHSVELAREKRATLGVVLGFSVALAGFGVSAYGFFLGHAAEAALVA